MYLRLPHSDLRNSEPLAEIILHEGKTVAQLDFWLPSEQFHCLCDVWFPLAWIVRSVLHHLYLHFRINELQANNINHFSRIRTNVTLTENVIYSYPC